MPEISVNIEVWCSECGKGICDLVSQGNKVGHITVEPCPKCLDVAYKEGYDEGYKTAKEELS